MKLISITLLTLCVAGPASADDTAPYKVIVHPNNPISSIQRAELARLYLKKAPKWEDGYKVMPVDHPPSSKIRAAFSEQVLKKSIAAVRSYWQQRLFSGRGVPPVELATDEEVRAYVAKHRGAVGYLSPKADTSSVRVISISE